MADQTAQRPPIRPRMTSTDLVDLSGMIARMLARPDQNLMQLLADDLNAHGRAIAILGRREKLDGTDIHNLFVRWDLTLRSAMPRTEQFTETLDRPPNRLRQMVEGQAEQDAMRGGQRHPAMDDHQ